MRAFHDLPASWYELLRRSDDVVLLENSLLRPDNRHSYLFHDPVRTLSIRRTSDVAGLLETIQTYVDQGYYLAGYVGYECGYALAGPRFADHTSEQPLAWFGVYRQPAVFDHQTGATICALGRALPAVPDRSRADEPYRISEISFDLSEQAYRSVIERVKAYISAGDVYQINLTGRYHFSFQGAALGLYRDLKRKQPVCYGAYVRSAGQEILCFSPELFFQLQGQRITVRPMKGTAPRGRSLLEDQAQAAWLHNDAKNRAENIMIVDLMRNDLGRISQIGSVTVPELFTVEQYGTLFQMTSTVAATLRDDLDARRLFESVFPCGSVTGAPKIRAMEIIRELEHSPRGVYTGSIGYFAPASSTLGAGRRAVFNVAIRTVVLERGRGTMGVGSGIVADSVADDEYAECAVKAQFLIDPPIDWEIIEAILWLDGFQRLERHLGRMAESAAYFGYPFDQAEIEARLVLEAAGLAAGRAYKVRLLLGRNGALRCESLPVSVSTSATPLVVGLSATRTSSRDRFLRHKTTSRALYDRASRRAERAGYADLLFLNERGEVTEGATNSIFVERAGELLTPPLECGVLPGVYRAWVLEHHPAAREAVLTLADLQQAEQIYLCNAIRGWREVTLDSTPLAL